jgi:hypothetical protein
VSPIALQATALVLLLVALPLIVLGVNNDLPALTVAGMVAVVLGGAIPPALRYVGPEEDA